MFSVHLPLYYHYAYLSAGETTYIEEELSEPVLMAIGGYSNVASPYRLGIFVRIFTPRIFTAANVGSMHRIILVIMRLVNGVIILILFIFSMVLVMPVLLMLLELEFLSNILDM